jgi:hypothetical protein
MNRLLMVQAKCACGGTAGSSPIVPERPADKSADKGGTVTPADAPGKPAAKTCRPLSLEYSDEATLACAEGLCGAKFKFKVTKVNTCPGDDCKGKSIGETLTTDGKCVAGDVEQGPCPDPVGDNNTVSNCSDTYKFCFKPKRIPDEGCTETYTLRDNVGGVSAGVCKIVWKLTKTDGKCSATVSRSCTPESSAQCSTAEKKSAAPMEPSEEPAPAPLPMVQAKCACGGSCAGCQEKQFQMKLAASSPHDFHEYEADRVADRVMSAPAVQFQRTAIGITPLLQRAAGEASTHTPGSARIHDLERCGHPLPENSRAFFETRFERDFGNVRVHADGRADELARSVNALAFTHANHIVFRAGEYDPNAPAGKRLLAHELTHTIQQGAVTAGPSVRRTPHSQ